MKTKKKSKLYEWQQRCKQGTEKCSRCGDTKGLTVDHIVPSHLLLQLSTEHTPMAHEWEENFEILCMYCNRMKGGNLDVRNPKTYQVLRKALQEAEDYFEPK